MSDTYRSNMIRMLMENYVHDSQVGPASTAKEQKNQVLYSGLFHLENYLRDLQPALDSIPTTTFDVKEGQVYAGVQIHKGNNMKVKVTAPTSLDVVGSYLVGDMVLPNRIVDVAIEMPDDMFEDKDIAQYKYFDKRAVYLSAVAAHLSQYDDLRYADVTVSNFHGDGLKPILLIHPTLPVDISKNKGPVQLKRAKGFLGKSVIRIFAVPKVDTFVHRRLAPARNNLKQIEIQSSQGVQIIDNNADGKGSPTPLYNQSILEDMFMTKHFYESAERHSEYSRLGQATSLLKVWGGLRGLSSSDIGYTYDSDRTKHASHEYSVIDTSKINPKKLNLANSSVKYEYSTIDDGFTGFHFSQVIQYLCANGTITETQDLYQYIFNTLMFIASTDFTTTPTFFPEIEDEDIKKSDKPAPNTFTASFDAVFLDSYGLVNLFARVSPTKLKELRHHALCAIVTLAGNQALNNIADKHFDEQTVKSVHLAGANYLSEEQAFDVLFLQQVHFNTQYDAYISINIPSAYSLYLPALTNSNSNKTLSASPLLIKGNTKLISDCDSTLMYPKQPSLSPLSALSRCAFPLITRALTDRYYLATLHFAPTNSKSFGFSFTLGLSYRTENAFRTLDQGPSADDKVNAPIFRKFWGEKSELRRFQDGTITEAVLWNVSVTQLHTVVPSIVSYILSKHLIPDQSKAKLLKVHAANAPLDAFLLKRPTINGELNLGIAEKSDATALSHKANLALGDLTKSLHNMRELPLDIKDIMSASSILYGTAPFPPSAIDIDSISHTDNPQTDFEAIEVIFNFGTSGKWPDELLAIVRIKTAFYLKIGELLKNKFGYPTTVTNYYIDTCVKGFIFRLRLHHPREVTLFKQDASVGKNLPIVVGDGYFRSYEKRIIHKPSHSQRIKGLTTQYSLLAPVTRLVTRWINSHLLSHAFPQEVIELLCAYVFVSPQPYTVPSSLLTAFIRVLNVIISHNWEHEPLIVPNVMLNYEEKKGVGATINSINYEIDMDKDVVTEIISKFKQRRQHNSGATMYICTNDDLESRIWTMRAGLDDHIYTGDESTTKLTSNPNITELDKLIALSKITLNAIDSITADFNNDFTAWLALFKTPLELYDSYILLDEKTINISKAKQSLFILSPIEPESSTEEPTQRKSKKKKSTYKLPADLDVNVENAAKKDDDSVDSDLPVYANFDPIELYLNELRGAFGSIADFYYDGCGGRVIAIKFKEGFDEATKPHQFLGFQPTEKGQEYVTGNRLDILDQMGYYGEGIVSHVFPTFADFESMIQY